ncbi:MAG: hypothetical protein CMO80_04230 [Verrucomicrobiales bacterium]|nr:hypothetical protein [Verrucomicrobiales bacterium]
MEVFARPATQKAKAESRMGIEGRENHRASFTSHAPMVIHFLACQTIDYLNSACSFGHYPPEESKNHK